MKARILLLLAPLALFACGKSSGGSSSGSGSGSTSTGGSGGSSGSGGATGSTGGSSGASSSSNTGTSSSSGAASSTGGSSGTSGACAKPCTYDNDCGGKYSCFNDCCVATADSCQSGSCAYGSCAPGTQCDNASDCCLPVDAGGSGSSSGGSGSTSGGSGSTSGGWNCAFDAGYHGGTCVPECNRGFHCEGGQCVLNGGGGPIQVTLRWDQGVDLDLHVVEPGGCEVYYGNRTCVGSLDLDSNPACSLDNVDIENVIYPDGGTPPSGTYTVRVDDYEDDPSAGCTGGGVSIPYKVIVRHGAHTDTYCEGFQPNSQDNGSAGSGVTITTFTYP